MKSLTAEQVLFIHSRIIDETGGAHGVRDVGLLKAAVARPDATFGGQDLYPAVFYRSAALMESLARNHPFLDGNKRTAIVATGIFLELNGFRLQTTQKELERFTLDVATGVFSHGTAAKWLKTHCIPLK
jgi:death-on-curing protein